MELIPLDLLAYICLKLPTQAILYLATTSKTLNEGLILNEFWRSLCIRDYFQFLGEQDRATTVDWKAVYVKIYRSRPNWLDPRVKLSFTSTTNFNNLVLSFAYDADNRLAFIGSGHKHINCFHLNAKRRFEPLVDYNIPDVKPGAITSALAVNRKLLAVGMSNGTALVFDKDNQSLLLNLSHTPSQNMIGVEFCADNKLVTALHWGTIKLWDVTTGTLLETAQDPTAHEHSRSLAVNSEQNLCVYTSGGQIIARDLRVWSKIGQIKAAPAHVSRVHFNSEKKDRGGMYG
eukprot:TRINITY_DN5894_c0_g1_i1.p1 TRINITY_DN5894_c0_g1~~TRINITY_DN5894_c0_g1_i1.p1  ORF type:complete len:300 (+),score=6.53 TRINITY_DN5894_c0_g1_i1:35-901(+)